MKKRPKTLGTLCRKPAKSKELTKEKRLQEIWRAAAVKFFPEDEEILDEPGIQVTRCRNRTTPSDKPLQ
jgi:hypothetical protein